jgi:hypothetical protein
VESQERMRPAQSVAVRGTWGEAVAEDRRGKVEVDSGLAWVEAMARRSVM